MGKDRNRYIERKRIRNRNEYGRAKKIDKCEAKDKSVPYVWQSGDRNKDRDRERKKKRNSHRDGYGDRNGYEDDYGEEEDGDINGDVDGGDGETNISNEQLPYTKS